MNKKNNLILGSGSPRRQDILRSLGLDFQVLKPEIDEVSKFSEPKLFCEDIAARKFDHISESISSESAVIITGDTIVCFKDKIYGKPKDYLEAFETIRFLSGKCHQVVTSLCVGFSHGRHKVTRTEVTNVNFFELANESIEHYLKFNTYRDKAGSYAIQDPNCYFVSSIEGSLTNVIGLPIELLEVLLEDVVYSEFGHKNWKTIF